MWYGFPSGKTDCPLFLILCIIPQYGCVISQPALLAIPYSNTMV